MASHTETYSKYSKRIQWGDGIPVRVRVTKHQKGTEKIEISEEDAEFAFNSSWNILMKSFWN